MIGKVAHKSPYGFKVEGSDAWVNYGNYYKGTREYNKGDTIEYEIKGKYLVSLKVLAAGEQPQAATKTKCPSCSFEF